MTITEVRITKLKDSKTLALASITIGEDFVVTGLSVYNGNNGMWVSMPSRKNSKPDDGTDRYKAYLDIAYPITKGAREQIQSAVLAKYNELDQFASDTQRQVYKDVHSEAPSIDVTEDDLPF